MITNRRDFSRALLAVAAGAPFLAGAWPEAFAAGRLIELGIQLYSVRNECERDLRGTLAALRAMGYRELEFFTFYGKPFAEIRRLLDDLGQSCLSAHYHYPVLAGDLFREIEYAQGLGVKYMVSAWIPQELRNTRDDWERIASALNLAGERCRKAGIQLVYHNHNFEFRRFEDQTAFDLLLNRTSPELVKLEIDCYWMAAAGVDPVRYLESHGGRTVLLHIKDRKAGFAPTVEMNEGEAPFAVLGQGTISYDRILAAAGRAGVRLAYIDQDACEAAPLQCAKASFKAWQRLR